jgi:hypothetical protein
MALNQGQVIDVTQSSATDGNQYIAPLGRQTEQLVTELHGKYYTQAYRGRLFHGSINTAAAIPVTSATGLTGPVLWNKTGNSRNMVLVRLTLGWTGTTEAPGAFQLAWAGNAGSTVATGALMTAFTAVTPYNANLGSGTAATCFMGSAATLTAAMTQFITLGFSHLTTTGTSTFGSFQIIYDFDGTLIIPPGVAATIVATTATASLYTSTVSWYESPV